MSNFAFLENEWPDIYEPAREAELYIHSARISGNACRVALEGMVHWLYNYDDFLRRPSGGTLSSLIHAECFKRNMPETVHQKVRYLNTNGNRGSHHHSGLEHQRPLSQGEALRMLLELHHVLHWFKSAYSEDETRTDHRFDKALLPLSDQQAEMTRAQLQQLTEQLERQRQELAAHAQQLQEDQQPLKQRQEQVSRVKQRNSQRADSHDYNEAETREFLIDCMLREAGWDPGGQDVAEYHITGMPSTKRHRHGNGYADYVLWSNDGRPLAVVEAKRAAHDPETGRVQGENYVEGLERMFGVRPVLYYSNGYQVMYWDDTESAPREVAGYHGREELETLILRRRTREPLFYADVNEAIANREYQKAAIQSVCDAFAVQKRRRALLVMATGTGKTRTTIALVDLLCRKNWALRVLFLADRVVLLEQARKNFKEHMSDTTTCILDTAGVRAGITAQMCMATYPTMLNLIDEINDNGQRHFGIGHFDLIVADEAHRSIYRNYRAIFEYFDGYVLGLTATPKEEVDRNTYNFFKLQSVPTYAYGLDEAIEAGYLVGFDTYEAETRFQGTGIKYDEWSDEDKDRYEDDFEGLPDKVDAAEFNRFVSNPHTVDLVLANLMEDGIKVGGGDEIGKTIIFARDHKHALLIEERFNDLWAKEKGHLARAIDYQTDPDRVLVQNFLETPMPAIAISVDMLDTDIDLPGLVNLVFFKMVRSKTKFWQMLGRGTRTCENLFGPGKHKTVFKIFDHCGSTSFFKLKPGGKATSAGASLGSHLFGKRLRLAQRLVLSEQPAEQDLGNQLLDQLHARVTGMRQENVLVRRELALITELKERSAWQFMKMERMSELSLRLADLPTTVKDDVEPIRRFDNLIVSLQLGLEQKPRPWKRHRERLEEIAHELLSCKGTVNQVKDRAELLRALIDKAFWKDVDAVKLEEVRIQLRELAVLLDGASRTLILTDLQDEQGELLKSDFSMGATYESSFNLERYREGVRTFLHKKAETDITGFELENADARYGFIGSGALLSGAGGVGS